MNSFTFFIQSHFLLISSILILAIGPLVYTLFKRSKKIIEFLDAFILVVIAGLVLFEIVPETWEEIGVWSLIMVSVGLFLPTVFERLQHHVAEQAHRLTLFVVMAGLVFHAFLDGVALLPPQALQTLNPHHAGSLLPQAILAHRTLDGLMIWMLLRPVFGRWPTLLAMGLLSASTVAGFATGASVFSGGTANYFGFFEAFIAGSLLHVLFHRHDPRIKTSRGLSTKKTPTACCCHDHAHQEADPSQDWHTWQWAAGLGAILGLMALWSVFHNSTMPHSLAPESSWPIFFNLALLSAPALVFAYFFSGLINSFLPEASVRWMGRGGPFLQAFKGMAIGLPLPVCSCGIVPLYRALVKRGMPLAAGIAFFVATPELSLDAVFLTYPLLGGQFMLVRLIAAALVALGMGLVINRLFGPLVHTPSPDRTATPQTSFGQRFKTGMWAGLADMVDHTGPWIVVGLALATLVQPLLDNSHFLELIPSVLQVPLFALLGMPVYICASGATPLVAVLIFHGVSPGAAIAFLLTGPATNVTTFGVLAQMHGRKLALTFGGLMALFAVCSGYGINLLPMTLPQGLPAAEQEHVSAARMGCLLLLALIYAFSLIRRGPQRWIKQIMSFDVPGDERKTSS